MTLPDQLFTVAMFATLVVFGRRGTRASIPLLLLFGAFVHRDHVGVEHAVEACIAGMLAGDLWLYGAARDLGSSGVDGGPLASLLPPPKRAWLQAMFAQYGHRILAARHLPGLGPAVVAMAGVRQVDEAQLVLWDLLGLLLVVPLGLGAGWLLDLVVGATVAL